jgi:hypothetical protein
MGTSVTMLEQCYLKLTDTIAAQQLPQCDNACQILKILDFFPIQINGLLG